MQITNKPKGKKVYLEIRKRTENKVHCYELRKFKSRKLEKKAKRQRNQTRRKNEEMERKEKQRVKKVLP